MTITNGYITLSEARVWLGLETTDTTANDAVIESSVESASRAIDLFCNRHFYTMAATMYYTPEDARIVFTDDIVSITALKTDDNADGTYETSWTADAHYYKQPYNAAYRGRPYTFLEISDTTTKYFPNTVRRGLQIYGVFGWSAVPKDVKQACKIETAREYRRKQTPLGVEGNTQVGLVRMSTDDPDVKRLLEPYVKNVLPDGG